MCDSDIEKLEIDQYDIPANMWRGYTIDTSIDEEMLFNKPDITKNNCDVYHIMCLDARALEERGEYILVAYQRAHAPLTFEAVFATYLDPPDVPTEKRVSPDINYREILECSRNCKREDAGFEPVMSNWVAHFAIMISLRRRRALGTSPRAIVHKIILLLGGHTVWSDDPSGLHGPMEVLDTCESFNTFFLDMNNDSLCNLERTFRGSRDDLSSMESIELGVKLSSVMISRKANRLIKRWTAKKERKREGVVRSISMDNLADTPGPAAGTAHRLKGLNSSFAGSLPSLLIAETTG